MAGPRHSDRPRNGPDVGDVRAIGRGLSTLFERFLYADRANTHGAPHLRSTNNVQRQMNLFVLATLPCWFIGLWNIGHQSNLAMQQLGLASLDGWRGALLDGLGIGHDPHNVLACFSHGLLYFLPVFLTALLVGAFWESLFARLRRRPLDEGLLAIAWLYAMILPAHTPLYQVVLGMSFGMVIGKLIYGGSGRYLVNPALLALAFLMFSYPGLVFNEGAWIPVPGHDQPTALEIAIKEGGVAALQAANYDWGQLFLGQQPGPMGVTSILGVLLGAVILLLTRAASWRIMLGGLLGMIAAVLIFNAMGPEDHPLYVIPWYWHLVLGGFAFGIVFLATDPVPAATTNLGRWLFGITVGLLTIVVRVTNPAHYEGVVFAILLASILAPLMDFGVVEWHIRQRRKRLTGAGP